MGGDLCPHGAPDYRISSGSVRWFAAFSWHVTVLHVIATVQRPQELRQFIYLSPWEMGETPCRSLEFRVVSRSRMVGALLSCR